MKWTDLLTAEMEYRYACTKGLLEMVTDDDLSWKPDTGENWMTTGQLLRHTAEACGMCMKGFVTGEWPDFGEMLPGAENMPAVETVDQAKQMLEADHALAREMIKQAGEERFETEPTKAPWDPNEVVLGHRLLQMVDHLNQHKGQLFYYLKLQGKPVTTAQLWGM